MPLSSACGDLNSHPDFSTWTLDIDVPVKHTTCAAPKFSSPGNFRPLNVTTGQPCHGLPSRQHFLIPYSCIHPSVLDLGSGMGQTDQRTDRQPPNNKLSKYRRLQQPHVRPIYSPTAYN